MSECTITLIGRKDICATSKGLSSGSLVSEKLPVNKLKDNLNEFVVQIEKVLSGVNARIVVDMV